MEVFDDTFHSPRASGTFGPGPVTVRARVWPYLQPVASLDQRVGCAPRVDTVGVSSTELCDPSIRWSATGVPSARSETALPCSKASSPASEPTPKLQPRTDS